MGQSLDTLVTTQEEAVCGEMRGWWCVGVGVSLVFTASGQVTPDPRGSSWAFCCVTSGKTPNLSESFIWQVDRMGISKL